MSRLPERRLVIVNNPRSSNSRRVDREVFGRLDEHDLDYRRVMSRYPDAASNIADFTDQLRDGDQVIVASGDGMASQVANAALLCEQPDVEIGFLPYGNFNDLARAHTRVGTTVLDLVQANTTDLIPLGIDIDGQHWRYALAHATIGWSAVAAASFDHALSRYITRNTLPVFRRGVSLLQVAYEYYRHRDHPLPDFRIDNSDAVHSHITDIVAINHPTIAGSIGSDRRWYDGDEFGYNELDVSQFFPNLAFGLHALARQMPLTARSKVRIQFSDEMSLPIQTEGEAEYITASEVVIEKTRKHQLRVLHDQAP